jgi:hypothetical protein
MPPTVKVKSSDSAVKKQREDEAQRVVAEFGDTLPDCRLLCFFDDEDCREFKRSMGEGNRGFHRPICDSTAFAGWPEYITESIFIDDPMEFWFKRVFDHVIYLHGSTCSDRVGMTMTFAHELQHVIQRIQVPELLSANGLFRHLPETLLQSIGLQWSDIPTEREARAVAKRIAGALHGDEAVKQFLVQRALTTTDPIELADVHFIQALDTSTPYVLKDETLALFGRFKNYRAEFETVIERFKSDPEFEPVNLDSFMPPVAV